METSTILSITLTASISALSLIASIVTIIINNHHQKQIKILDIIYEKKYQSYQKFFQIYANYRINNEFDKTVLSNVIVDCLLTSNQKKSYYLDDLLRNISNEKENKYIPQFFKNNFRYCIESMKAELNIK